MTIPLGIAIYFVIWWTVLFAVLPFGLRTQLEAGNVVPGTPSSAPIRPRFLRIVVATSLLAGAIFLAVYAGFIFNVIDLKPPLPQSGQN